MVVKTLAISPVRPTTVVSQYTHLHPYTSWAACGSGLPEVASVSAPAAPGAMNSEIMLNTTSEPIASSMPLGRSLAGSAGP